MSVRWSLFAATAVALLALALPASAQTLKYANQGELKSLDPYTLKETTTRKAPDGWLTCSQCITKKNPA